LVLPFFSTRPLSWYSSRVKIRIKKINGAVKKHKMRIKVYKGIVKKGAGGGGMVHQFQSVR